jgi:mono/diheme cytochrome c family protein
MDRDEQSAQEDPMRTALMLCAVAGVMWVGEPRGRADDAATARTFKSRCGGCHGPDGKGKTKQGEKMKIGDMTTAAFKKEMTPEKMKAAILDGFTRDKDGVKQEMKGLRGKIPDDQLDALIAYVRGLK